MVKILTFCNAYYNNIIDFDKFHNAIIIYSIIKASTIFTKISVIHELKKRIWKCI